MAKAGNQLEVDNYSKLTDTQNMKTYKIPVVWQVWDICEIEADSLEKAIEKARDGAPTRGQGEYVGDSLEIDEEGVEQYNL